MELIRRIVSEDTYEIFKYSRARLLGSHNAQKPEFGTKVSWKFLTKATGSDKAVDFRKEIERDIAGGRVGTVYVNGLAPRSEDRGAVLSMLEQHIGSNLIQIGKDLYHQKEGIPQGSIVSTLLCSYFYAELERKVLGFVNDGKSVLFRLIDDFLVISTERGIAEEFMRRMHAGLPEFGVQVKAEKTRVNFDTHMGDKVITKVTGAEFPYCGQSINTSTLDLSKDRERRRKASTYAICSSCGNLLTMVRYRRFRRS
jgi:telomerase reverse transcriptase